MSKSPQYGIWDKPSLAEWEAGYADIARYRARIEARAQAEREINLIFAKRETRNTRRAPDISLRARLRAFKASKKKTRDAAALRAQALPAEKLRRSRVDWFGLVPEDVARSQVRYERQQTANAMRESGLSWAEVGARFGVSASRASQIAHPRWKTPPVERHYERLFDADSFKSSQAMIANLASLPTKRDWLYV